MMTWNYDDNDMLGGRHAPWLRKRGRVVGLEAERSGFRVAPALRWPSCETW
jgi:hypothetical protein